MCIHNKRLPAERTRRAILRDESIYPDPDVFRPERFLDEAPQPDPHNLTFGYGRR